MKTDLFYLVATTVFTGMMWLPYVLDRVMVRGVIDSVGFPANPKPQSPWAQRLMKAHSNAIENLVIFATLVLTANVLGITAAIIGTACMVFFWARVVHALAFTFGIPWVRTLAFVAGVVAEAIIVMQLLAR